VRPASCQVSSLAVSGDDCGCVDFRACSAVISIRSPAADELHDFDLVALGHAPLRPRVARDHVAIDLDGDTSARKPELRDQIRDRRAGANLGFAAVDVHLHVVGITPRRFLYNLPVPCYRPRVTSISGPVARIDLTSLVHNFREVERLVGPQVSILAMVKADAYGHGAVAVTRALLRASCRVFGTATVDEAARLKDDTPLPADARVVVFGGIPPSLARDAAVIGAEVATHDADVVRALGEAGRALGREIPVHVKVDTGMHRLGVEPRDASAFVDMVRATRGVRAVALCSHFAMAESVTTDVTEGQLDRLVDAVKAVERTGERLPAHLANSAGIMTRPESHLDMVRPGLMLYGLYPDISLRSRADLRPVMTLMAPVVRVATVAAGEGIGYGHSFRAAAPLKVATLRCGYADGYPRALSNRGQVLIASHRAPVVGRVCMDHTMVDVSGAGDVRSGDIVTLWGPALAAEEIAAFGDTISYELVARVGARVTREYVDG